MLLIYTHWKHQKTFRFSDVFRWYRYVTLGCIGLNSLNIKVEFGSNLWLEHIWGVHMGPRKQEKLWKSTLNSYCLFAWSFNWENVTKEDLKCFSLIGIFNKSNYSSFLETGLNSPENHCVKSVRIRIYSGPDFSRIFPHSVWTRRDTPYFLF